MIDVASARGQRGVMHVSPRLAIVVIVAVNAVVVAGCPGQTPECTRDADCADDSFCNGDEVCGDDGTCHDGTPPRAPTLGDCASAVCDDAQASFVITADDAQCEDDEPCTLDVCDATLGCQHPQAPGVVPPQAASDDCLRTVCAQQGDGSFASVDVANDDELPPQQASGDCRREVCFDGAPVSTNNDTDTPADVGCVVGSCNQGTPQSTPTDALCGGGVCLPADPGADADGCVPP